MTPPLHRIFSDYKPLYRYDHTPNDRRYARIDNDGNVVWYPSVTTIIKATSPTPPGLMAWYAKHGFDEATTLRDEAAERGTQMHLNIAEMLEGRPVDLAMQTEFQAKALMSFDAFRQEWQVEPLAVEVMLHNDTHIYAGACDLVAYMTNPKTKERLLSIVDFKSGASSYDDHAVQTEMYRQAWNSMLPPATPHRVEAHYNWHPKDWRKAPTYTLKDNTGKVEPREIELRSGLFRINNECKPKSRHIFRGVLPGDGHFIEIDADEVIREAYLASSTR